MTSTGHTLADASATAEVRPPVGASPPAADTSLGAKLLPAVLSLIAGSTDVISFLGLGGLFAAHITGDLVVLAAHVVEGGTAPLAPMLALPVFIAVLGLTRLLAGVLQARQHGTLRPLLGLQFLLLANFLTLCVVADAHADPNAPIAVVAGMLGVAAMAVQNAMVQISLPRAPSTAVMTTNITRFVMDLGTVLVGRDPQEAANACDRAKHAWPVILGFAVGCGLGAACQAAFGLRSLALPTGLALVAFVMSFDAHRHR